MGGGVRGWAALLRFALCSIPCYEAARGCHPCGTVVLPFCGRHHEPLCGASFGPRLCRALREYFEPLPDSSTRSRVRWDCSTHKTRWEKAALLAPRLLILRAWFVFVLSAGDGHHPQAGGGLEQPRTPPVERPPC